MGSRLTERGSLNYVGMGSLTPAVTAVLIGREPEHENVFVRHHDLALIYPIQMSSQEREILGGSRRYVALRNFQNEWGIKGWLYRLKGRDLPFVLDFDVTDKQAYRLGLIVVRAGQEFIQAHFVSRIRRGQTFQLCDSLKYDPYEPFSSDPQEGERLALMAARESRKNTLKD